MLEMINKILIVDDQVSFLNGMSKALKSYCDFPGEIKTVENGEKAIAEVSSSFYDVCFLDLNLPDISGLDVMKKIHYISPKTKVVIMTADYLDEDVKTKIEKGASLLISKPVELDDVRNFIRKESGLSVESIEEEHAVKGHREEGKETEKGPVLKGPRGAERRQHARQSCKKTVYCSLSVFYSWEMKSGLKTDIIDMSTEGAGIIAAYPLYPGNVLKFDESLEHRSGIVKWSRKDAGNFRAGIRFL
jgi:DNA-binding NtrC family response regulator